MFSSSVFPCYEKENVADDEVFSRKPLVRINAGQVEVGDLNRPLNRYGAAQR